MVVLTERERIILKLLSDGAPDKLIAYECGCGLRTAEGYVAKLIDDLGVPNRMMAGRWYWSHEEKVRRGIPADLGFRDLGPMEGIIEDEGTT